MDLQSVAFENAPRTAWHRLCNYDEGGALVFSRNGLGGAMPRCSATAISHAIAAGVDGLDVDLHRDAQGNWVVLDEPQLDHQSDGIGLIGELEPEKWRQVHLGWTDENGFGFGFDERIVDLNRLLEVIDHKAILCLRLHGGTVQDYEQLTDTLVMAGWSDGIVYRLDAGTIGSLAALIEAPFFQNVPVMMSSTAQQLEANPQLADLRVHAHEVSFQHFTELYKALSICRAKKARVCVNAGHIEERFGATDLQYRRALWRSLLDAGASILTTRDVLPVLRACEDWGLHKRKNL